MIQDNMYQTQYNMKTVARPHCCPADKFCVQFTPAEFWIMMESASRNDNNTPAYVTPALTPLSSGFCNKYITSFLDDP